MKKKALVLVCSFLVLLTVTSCDNTKNEKNSSVATVESVKETEKEDKLYSYIERNYGFCESSVQGVFTAAPVQEGATLNKGNMRFSDGMTGGAVYYKKLDDAEQNMCVFLDDRDGERINLSLTCFQLSQDGFVPKTSSTITLAQPHMKSRCYCAVNGKYIVVVQLEDKSEGWYDRCFYLAHERVDSVEHIHDFLYQETIYVYDYTESLFEPLFKLQREITSYYENDTKSYIMKYGDNNWAYASGCDNYINDWATLVTTEQEICDKANMLLREFDINWITVERTSWENRWYRLEIDENGIPDSMAKVDFNCSYSEVDKNGNVQSDINIEVNAEKEPNEEIEPEKADIPVIYGESPNMDSNLIVMPEFILNSVDESQLHDLTDFNLDGYWYSSDLRYVFYIFTNSPDNGFNTYYFVDLQGSDGAKYGTVQQTSSYSINLKPREDNEKVLELFAENQQLVSDEIILTRADDNIADSIWGEWQNGDKRYTFESDGTYWVHDGQDSYWCYYFPIDESRIVLGEYSENLKKQNHSFKCFNYVVDNDSLIIEGKVSLSR